MLVQTRRGLESHSTENPAVELPNEFCLYGVRDIDGEHYVTRRTETLDDVTTVIVAGPFANEQDAERYAAGLARPACDQESGTAVDDVIAAAIAANLF